MYAHSIKNPHIIHYRQLSPYQWLKDTEYQYLCSIWYTPSKATEDKKRVTCKNCLRELAKQVTRP